jgi:acetate kinase
MQFQVIGFHEISRSLEIIQLIDRIAARASSHNSAAVREAVCGDLGFLGLELDSEANQQPSKQDRVISTSTSRVAVWVVYTNEELVVARESARVIGQS